MKAKRIKGLMIIMAFCAVVSVPSISNAIQEPYNIDNLEDFLGNATYFNGYSPTSPIPSFNFSGAWEYTAIAAEAANLDITEDPTNASAVTFSNQNTANWGIWRPINFDSANIYFTDSGDSQPINSPLDPYAYNGAWYVIDYFKLYQLTANSQTLSYLPGNPTLVLSTGTYILGFNDNRTIFGEKDFDDLVVAMRPAVPEPTTLLLLGLGLLGVAGVRRLKK